jgi:hypothetical protein
VTPTLQDIVVLLFVAVAAVYTVARLRRVATGQNKCACGAKSCGAASPCGGNIQKCSEPAGPGGGLPVLPSSCGQGGCGCGKS